MSGSFTNVTATNGTFGTSSSVNGSFTGKVTTPEGIKGTSANNVLYAGKYHAYNTNTSYATSSIRALKDYNDGSSRNGPSIVTGSVSKGTELNGKYGGMWDVHDDVLMAGWAYNYRLDNTGATQVNLVATCGDGVGRTIFKNIRPSGTNANSEHRLMLNGDVEITSDDRLKSNEVPITNALNSLMTLSVKRYNKLVKPVDADFDYQLSEDNQPIDDEGHVVSHSVEIGLIAQELVGGAFSSCVNISSDVSNTEYIDSTGLADLHSVDYTAILLHCIPAIQELTTKLNAAEDRIQQLENKLQN